MTPLPEQAFPAFLGKSVVAIFGPLRSVSVSVSPSRLATKAAKAAGCAKKYPERESGVDLGKGLAVQLSRKHVHVSAKYIGIAAGTRRNMTRRGCAFVRTGYRAPVLVSPEK